MTRSQEKFLRGMISREIYHYRRMKKDRTYSGADLLRKRGDIARLWGIRSAMRDLAKFDAEMAKR